MHARWLLVLLLLAGWTLGCADRSASPPAPTAIAPGPLPGVDPDATLDVPPTPTLRPTRTAPPATATAPPPTIAPSPTPAAVDLRLRLLSAVTGKPVAQAVVAVSSAARATSDADGIAVLPALAPGVALSVSVTADGFAALTQTVTPLDAADTVTLSLVDAPRVTIAQMSMRLRTGPGLAYPTLGLGLPGDQFRALGRDASGDWLLIDAGYAAETWVQQLPETVLLTGDVDALPLVAGTTSDNE